MKIGFTSDHGGYELKKKMVKLLEEKHDIIDYGTNSLGPVDYPDYAMKLGKGIASKKIDLGIAICRTGIGMSIALNKINGIRCANVENSQEASVAREHNNANVIAIRGNMTFITAQDVINSFLKTKFSSEPRHMRRIEKIKELEKRN